MPHECGWATLSLSSRVYRLTMSNIDFTSYDDDNTDNDNDYYSRKLYHDYYCNTK